MLKMNIFISLESSCPGLELCKRPDKKRLKNKVNNLFSPGHIPDESIVYFQ